jgi:hypothetical protein
MMRASTSAIAAGLILLPFSALAQTAPPPSDPNAPAAGASATGSVGVTAGVGVTAEGTALPPPPVATPPAQAAQRSWRDAITLDGLADTYYGYRFSSAALEDANYRVFDFAMDSFVINHMKLGLGVKAEPAGLRLDIGFGPIAALTSSDGAGNGTFQNIQQAYATFALSTNTPLTIDVGKFVTSAGAEVIESNRNWNYSRSFLFGYAIPFTHTGVRLTAALSNQFTLQAMVVNGWDVIYDNNAAKTFGVSATFAAPTGTTLILNTLLGIEAPDGPGDEDWRFLVDLVASHTIGNLGLVLNFDYGVEGDANWYGVAGMGRFTVVDWFNLSLRGEYFADPDAVRMAGVPPDTSVTEFTVTGGFPVGANAELRAELRADFASEPIFARDGEPEDNQLTVMFAAMAWF